MPPEHGLSEPRHLPSHSPSNKASTPSFTKSARVENKRFASSKENTIRWVIDEGVLSFTSLVMEPG